MVVHTLMSIHPSLTVSLNPSTHRLSDAAFIDFGRLISILFLVLDAEHTRNQISVFVLVVVCFFSEITPSQTSLNNSPNLSNPKPVFNTFSFVQSARFSCFGCKIRFYRSSMAQTLQTSTYQADILESLSANYSLNLNVPAILMQHMRAGSILRVSNPLPTCRVLEYRLQDYSAWLQHQVEKENTWRSIKSCLLEKGYCQDFPERFSVSFHLSPGSDPLWELVSLSLCSLCCLWLKREQLT
jgi:hypothetical protein